MKASSYEKELLLDSVNELLLEKDNNITLGLVLTSFLVISIVMTMVIPKIYFSNSIYQESLKINKLQREYRSLYNEHKILKAKIDKIKFENGVTH
ncbi:MAG: hypothetical protein DSY40_02580 [Nautilia sp.]|nr:MAG: hypothetical protein DSY40_02580 [Nautilia sp.]